LETVGKSALKVTKMEGLKKYDSVNGLNSAQYLEILQMGNLYNESTSELMIYAKTCQNMGGIFYSEVFKGLFACSPFKLQNVLSFEEFKKKLKVTIKKQKS
jgi:hypothetical protein